jgi:hypothetical protein
VIKRMVIALSVLWSLGLALSPRAVLANCHGGNYTIDSGIKCGAGGLNTTRTAFGPTGFFTGVIDTIIFLTGAVAVLFVIIGGIRYVFSTGDPKATGQAKDTIMFALIGLAIAAGAYAIVRFVIDKI